MVLSKFYFLKDYLHEKQLARTLDLKANRIIDSYFMLYL